MKTKSALLGGAALGVLLAANMTGAAQAKTMKHHHAARAASSEMEQKVDSLTETVSALEQRLNDQAAAQQATEQRAQAAEAKADAAEADAQAAHQQLQTQIATIPGEVHTEIAAAAPKPGWWNNTQVHGTAFMDLTDINQQPHPSASANNVLNKNENGFNFDIKRFYISIDHQFNDMFSANVTTDFTYDNATATVAGTPAQTLTVSGCTPMAPATKCTVTVPATASQTLVTGDKVGQLYLKKAYLQAKFSDALMVRVGSADLPWVPYVEGIYGYRYVENTLIDRTKYGTSADWGVHVLGTIPVDPMLSFNYQISAINGLGYKQPGLGTVNRSNTMDFEGRVGAVIAKKINVAVGGYSGKLGQDVQGVVAPNTSERFDAIVAYVDPVIHAGFEYFWAKDDMAANVTAKAGTNITTQGYSIFGAYNFTPQIALFGRYDWVKPNSTVSNFTDNYYNVGVSYEPTKIVDFALVYKRDSVDNGALGTSNGTIGAGSGKTGTYDEVGVWTQFKW